MAWNRAISAWYWIGPPGCNFLVILIKIWHIIVKDMHNACVKLQNDWICLTHAASLQHVGAMYTQNRTYLLAVRARPLWIRPSIHCYCARNIEDKFIDFQPLHWEVYSKRALKFQSDRIIFASFRKFWNMTRLWPDIAGFLLHIKSVLLTLFCNSYSHQFAVLMSLICTTSVWSYITIRCV